jgi:ferritin
MDKKLLEELNAQLNRELYNALLYLSMAAYFDHINLQGFAHYFRIQAKEEVEHAMKIYDFLNDRGERVYVEGIPKPKQEWSSPLEAIEDFYKAEVENSKKIYKIDDLAKKVNDKTVEHLMRWFVEEQIEEEKISSELLAKVKMLKDAPHGLYILDRELSGRKK